MKKAISLIVIICTLVALCTAETLPYQESRFLDSLRNHFKAATYISEGAMLEQTIKNNVFYERFEDLEIRVAHLSADMNCMIAEVVITCDKENTKLQVWEDPIHDTINSLKNTSDQTVYYINADYVTSCEARSYDTFDNGISFILWQQRPIQLEGSISAEIIVRVGIISPKGKNREVKEYHLPVSYDLMEPVAVFTYDTQSEPITEEITITSLQIIQTRLQVVEVFQYEKTSDEYYAKLEYGKPRIGPPEEFELRIYKKKKNELVKIIEFKHEGSFYDGRYVPVRYWTPHSFE